MRVIVDTNVIVSGLISPAGPPGKIVDALLQGFLIPVMSPATTAELEAVLARPRLRTLFDHARIDPTEFLSEFKELAEIVEPDSTEIPLRDENDRIFVDLVAAQPPVEFFVTGDRDFERKQYAGVPVVSPAAFVRAILPKQS